VERRIEVLGAAHLELVDDVALLEPRAQAFGRRPDPPDVPKCNSGCLVTTQADEPAALSMGETVRSLFG